jgi:hypothetical protein
MYIYRVKSDGMSINYRTHDPQQPIPNGWLELPVQFHGKIVYWDVDHLTEVKPQVMVDSEQAKETEQAKLKEEKISILQSLNYSNIDNHIDKINNLGDLKAYLKKAYKVIFWLVEQHPTDLNISALKGTENVK